MTRGHAGATVRLQAVLPWRISAVTYMELAQGCRNRHELEQVKQGLALCHTEILPISNAISSRAMELIDRYALSHGLQMGDADRRHSTGAWPDDTDRQREALRRSGEPGP